MKKMIAIRNVDGDLVVKVENGKRSSELVKDGKKTFTVTTEPVPVEVVLKEKKRGGELLQKWERFDGRWVLMYQAWGQADEKVACAFCGDAKEPWQIGGHKYERIDGKLVDGGCCDSCGSSRD